MRKITILLLTLAMVFSLSACGDTNVNTEESVTVSTHKSTLIGYYPIESVIYEGYYISPDDSMSTSMVSVTRSGKNIFAKVLLTIGDEYNLLEGHLSEQGQTDEFIKYKFWIDSSYGTLSESTDWIFIYYYPSSDSIEINTSDDICFEFVK